MLFGTSISIKSFLGPSAISEVNAGKHSAWQQPPGSSLCSMNAPFFLSLVFRKHGIYQFTTYQRKFGPKSSLEIGNIWHLSWKQIMFTSGKVSNSSFMSPHSMTVRDRAATWEVWEWSKLTKTQAFTIANTEDWVWFYTRTGSKGTINQPFYNCESQQSSSRRCA